jgi:hypothetical protein
MPLNQFKFAEAYAEIKLKGVAAYNTAIDAMKTRTSRFHKALQAAGPIITRYGKWLMALGAGAMAHFIRSAARAEETASKFAAVFKEHTAEAEKWVQAFASEVGRSRDALRGYMAQIQDTFVPLGYGRREATELSKRLTRLAVDLASFNNQSEPETVQLLTSALVGNHEAVRRYGIILTQSTLQQELHAMGIEKSVLKATDMEKVQARLNVIFRNSADAQGDAVRTAGEVTNQTRALLGTIQDLSAAYGDELLPYVREVVAALQSYVDTAEDAAKASDKLKEASTLRKALGAGADTFDLTTAFAGFAGRAMSTPPWATDDVKALDADIRQWFLGKTPSERAAIDRQNQQRAEDRKAFRNTPEHPAFWERDIARGLARARRLSPEGLAFERQQQAIVAKEEAFQEWLTAREKKEAAAEQEKEFLARVGAGKDSSLEAQRRRFLMPLMRGGGAAPGLPAATGPSTNVTSMANVQRMMQQQVSRGEKEIIDELKKANELAKEMKDKIDGLDRRAEWAKGVA